MTLPACIVPTSGLRMVLIGAFAPVAASLPAILLRWLRPGASAAMRHLVWLLAFATMGVCFLLALVNLRLALPILPPLPIDLPAAARVGTPTLAAQSGEPALLLPPNPPSASEPAVTEPPRLKPAPFRIPWPQVVWGIWAIGLAYVSGISLVGIVRVRRIIQRSRPAQGLPLAIPWAEICASRKHHPRARLSLSPEAGVPFVAGWWHPIVILPETATEWPPAMQRAALVHELAHIERNDLLSLMFTRLILSLYWFHPVAWYGWRALRAEAEMAADDRVVLAEADPVAYAEGLMILVRTLRGDEGALFPAIGMLRGEGIQARMERILDSDRSRRTPGWTTRWATLLGVVAVAIALLSLRPVAALAPSARAGEPLAAALALDLPPQEILIEAIAENDVVKAASAVKAGADPNKAIAYRHAAGGYLATETPFYYAAEQGRLPIVRLLLEHGADVKLAKPGRWTPLDGALHSGFGDVVQYLHEHGAACDPLTYAGAIGDVQAVQQLLPKANAKSVADAAAAAAGCNQVATLRELLGEKGDPSPAFRRASMAGAVEAMQFLLDHGVDLKAVGDDTLLRAADCRHPRAVALLLKAGVKPDPDKKVEYHPLHWAARSGDAETARLLLDAGADPNCLTADPELDQGTPPLFNACDNDDVELVKLLLDRGARTDIVNGGGFTAVLYAAYCHAPRCLAWFLDHGADWKAYNPKWQCGLMKFATIFTGEDAARPDQRVTIARVSRDMETVKVLLDRGMDVNATEEDGATPLSIAIGNGQTACMEILLQRGARVNTVDRRGATPLVGLLAVPVKEEWRLKVLNRLLAAGLDVNTGIDNPLPPDTRTPSALKSAIIYRGKLVKFMLEHGARFPVEKNSDAEKMLVAATTGDLATVKDLLARGVSPDVADARGWTPLLSASAMGDSATLKALVEAGANVNALDALGLTAIQFSLAKYPDLSDFHLLLGKGADLNAETQVAVAGSVLYRAIGLNDPVLTREILQHGAHPNRSPQSKNSEFDPITLAGEVLLMRDPQNEKRREIVRTLLEFGADPNHPSRPGERPLLYFPVTNNMVDLVKFLLQAGIDPRKDPDGGKIIAEQAERHGNAEMKALIKAALEKGAQPGD